LYSDQIRKTEELNEIREKEYEEKEAIGQRKFRN